jgi:hypothetical protein
MTPADPSPKGLRSYSVILAAEIGESAAQMFHRIWFFCARTESGKVIDGQRWIRNSAQQWRENHFPHWGLSKVNRAIDTLVREGLIFKDNHNPVKWLTALWYRVNPAHPLVIKAGYVEPEPIVQNEQMHLLKMNKRVCSKRINGFIQNEQMHLLKMNASNHRDNIKKDISKRLSSSSPGREEDEIIEKQIEQARSKGEGCGNADGESADSGPEENVSLAETEGEIVIPPPDPPDDLIMKIYGRVLSAIDLLSAPPKSVDLHPYIRAFRDHDEMMKFFSKEEIRAMSTPGPEALETKCAEFVERMLQDQFAGEVHGGFRVMAMRAVRGGFLNRYGFRDFCEKGLPKEYLDANPYENVIWEQW